MKWYEKIIRAHLAVTDAVSHGSRMKSERYFVWQEDGSADFMAGNRHAEHVVTGTTDLFTKKEFDPWADAFEMELNADEDISWQCIDIQYEEETGFWHYTWEWSVNATWQNGNLKDLTPM